MSLISAIVGGTIVAVTNWWVATTSAKTQHKLEQEKYKRALQDASRVKLEEGYGRLILAARRMSGTIQRQKFILQGETQEQRDKMLGEYLDEAWSGIEQIIIRLELERNAGNVLAIFQEIDEAITKFRVSKGMLETLIQSGYGPPNSEQIEEVEKQRKSKDDAEKIIHEGADKLAKAAQEHLDKLRNPNLEKLVAE